MAKQMHLNISGTPKKAQRVGIVTVGSRGKPVATLSTLKAKEPMRVEDHSAFGMWADREDMKDVQAWLSKMRTPRYLR